MEISFANLFKFQHLNKDLRTLRPLDRFLQLLLAEDDLSHHLLEVRLATTTREPLRDVGQGGSQLGA